MITREYKDVLAGKLMLLATVVSGLIAFVIVIVLFQKSAQVLRSESLSELLLSTSWKPWKGEFGFYPFIMGTMWVTMLAMILSAPSSLLTAIYIAEYAPNKIRGILKPVVDLLAAIPSVVYGLWGVLVVVPAIRNYVAPLAGVTSTGYTVLAGGIVLAIMVFPIVISISEEVIETVPRSVREASMALGATRWQTERNVVIRSALPGIIAAIMLGFGRAFGETMAVLMVVGNVPEAPRSFLDPGYPLPALIANNYGEMASIPMYDSALMLAALVLLVIVLLFVIASKVISAVIRRWYVIG